MPLINRLSMVTVDPFKDWNLDQVPKSLTIPTPQNTNNSTSTLSSSGRIKIEFSNILKYVLGSFSLSID